MSTKKIWVSRDMWEIRENLYDVWVEEPSRGGSNDIVFRHLNGFVGSMQKKHGKKKFGEIKPGQCKCFVIKEIKP